MAKDVKGKPLLAELPEELVSNIAVKLGIDDIASFRLTCRALEQRSFHEFATEYFRGKCIVITSESLKVLHGIGSSEKLRGYLHGLYIMPSLFSDRVFNCCHGPACTWKASVRQSEAWRQYVKDQQDLKKSGRDLEMLTQALQRLPSLTNLEFVDSVAGVPRNVDLRGLGKSVRSTNNNPAHIPSKPSDGEYYRWKNHVWDITTRALAASGKSTLLHFNTDLDQVKNSLSVSTNFNLDDETSSGLATVLKKVHLVGLYISSRKQSSLDDPDYDGIDIAQGVKHMAKFASLLPSLTSLRLCFSYSPSSRRLCHSFLSKTNLSQLRTLKLEKTFLSAKTVGPMMAKLTSVDEIFFVGVRLVEGNWRTLLKVMQKLEKLEHLHLMWLEEQEKLAVFLDPLPDTSNEDVDDMLGPEPHVHVHNHLFHGYDSDDDSALDDASDEFLFDDDEYDSDDEEYDTEEEKEVDVEQEFTGFNDSDVSDDSMPDLEPLDASVPVPQTTPQPAPTNASAAVLPTAPQQPYTAAPPPSTPTTAAGATSQHPHDDEDDDGLGNGPYRGQKMCVHGIEQIKRYLPIFIQEYHCADEEEEAAAAAAAVGGDPLSLLNSMLPMGMMGPMAAGGAGVIGGLLHGPPLPPGFAGAGAAGPG